jgi:hypothetical protein
MLTEIYIEALLVDEELVDIARNPATSVRIV